MRMDFMGRMRGRRPVGLVLVGATLLAGLVFSGSTLGASSASYSLPTWWGKYQALLQRTGGSSLVAGPLSKVGANVDVSNEDGPQSETSITLNPSAPKMLVGGSNEIFRLRSHG